MKVDDLRQTSAGFPTQWEGRVGDRPVYIRYRHGWLSVTVGPRDESRDVTVWLTEDGEEVLSMKLSEGDDGVISWDRVERLIEDVETGPSEDTMRTREGYQD